MRTTEEMAQKRFDEEDGRWTGPKFVVVGAITLSFALSLIYFMSTSTGCSLQIVH